jgi:uncharacterized glyoxalase superfamily protein PhnB
MTVGAISKRTATVSAMYYRDPEAAIEFLVRAFGFEDHAVLQGGDGKVTMRNSHSGTA